jgi:hypothetical protein
MIIPSGGGARARPADFRKGMDSLAALVSESLGADPYSGVMLEQGTSIAAAEAVAEKKDRPRRSRP